MMSDKQLQEMAVDIEIIKRDNSKFNSLFDKLDIAIEKLGNVSQDVSKLLAVHEEKLSRQEERYQELRVNQDQRYNEVNNDIISLEKRIAREREEHKQEFKQISEKLDAINSRLTILEKWRWWVMGGIAVAGFLLGNIITITLDNKVINNVPSHIETKQQK